MSRFALTLQGGLLATSLAVAGGCETKQSPQDLLPDGPLLMRPADHREPKTAEVKTPLPPIQGGSLLVTADGANAVVGDIDRHRVVGVSLSRGEVSFEVPVSAAALPGRMVEDTEGQVHMVMRGLGQLWTLSPEDGAVTRRLDVCEEPRGLAYENGRGMLHLACADGTLMSLGADSGEVERELSLFPDLRDVVVDRSGGLWVSTFRSARILHVDAEGALTRLPQLDGAEKFAFDGIGSFLSASGAFRMVSDGRGGATLVHQRSQNTDVVVDPHAELDNEVTGEDLFEPLDFGGGGSSYGGGSIDNFQLGETLCDAIVHSAVSQLFAGGTLVSSDALPNAVLAVDVAHDPHGRIAVAVAGQRDEGSPKSLVIDGTQPTVPDEVDCSDCTGSVQVMPEGDLYDGVHSFCAAPTIIPIEEPAVGVAFTPDGTHLLVQVREPARIYVVNPVSAVVEGRIELGGVSVEDTGHDLFHRDSGGSIACASCHLEGAEDGHTWSFTGLGPRRTQPLNVGIEGTQPFHWDGLMEGLGAIMNEVFVGRMGGAPQSPERVEALEQWVDTLTPPAPVREATDPAAKRGKLLFESDDVGCASCHVGEKLTNNKSVDVGTSDGVPLQVPSLLGVALRLPVMHDGCALTLHERFDAGCGGGDAHGQTSELSEAEIDDLVAYLETL